MVQACANRLAGIWGQKMPLRGGESIGALWLKEAWNSSFWEGIGRIAKGWFPRRRCSGTSSTIVLCFLFSAGYARLFPIRPGRIKENVIFSFCGGYWTAYVQPPWLNWRKIE